MERIDHPHDKLQLELFTAKEMLGTVVVWDGRSPRVLTRAFQKFSLGAPPLRGLRD